MSEYYGGSVIIIISPVAPTADYRHPFLTPMYLVLSFSDPWGRYDFWFTNSTLVNSKAISVSVLTRSWISIQINFYPELLWKLLTFKTISTTSSRQWHAGKAYCTVRIQVRSDAGVRGRLRLVQYAWDRFLPDILTWQLCVLRDCKYIKTNPTTISVMRR